MCEYLSKDILEEGHVRSFAPLRLLQMVLGSSRVDARDRFVTSPTIWQKIYSLVTISITFASCASVVYFYFEKYKPYPNLNYLCHVGILLHFLFYFFCVVHSRFVNNEMNVRFYIKLQEIDRKMNIEKVPYFYNLLYKVNVMGVLTMSIIIIIFSTLMFFSNFKIALCSLGFYLSQFTCTAEWVYFSNLILHLYSRLRFINTIIINHLNSNAGVHSNDVNMIKLLNNEALHEIATATNDFLSSETDVYLHQIFNALYKFTDLYRFQMFIFCFKFVLMTIMTFEFCLLSLQNNVPMETERIVLPAVAVGDLAILIFICVRWEAFFKEISETKHLSTTILATYTEGPLRKKAAVMLKAIEETPPHFSVYDMWNMDASTLLNILNIITTLTVTLLQFALL